MNEDNQDTQPDEGEENFAELLKQSFIASDRLKPGDKVSARIVKITPSGFLSTLAAKAKAQLTHANCRMNPEPSLFARATC